MLRVSIIAILCVLLTLVLARNKLALPECKFVPCDNNNQCGSFAGNCTKCNSTGFCDYGGGCGKTCKVTSDCNQAEDCKFCKDGVCTSSGSCGAYCSQQSDCVQAADCGFCINNMCVSQCASPCAEDSNCNYAGSTCPFCENFICQKGGCGSKCGSESDCARYGGDCKLCTNYPELGYAMCTSGCNMKCSEDSECAGFSTNCGTCNTTTHLCESGTCGTKCNSNNGCENSPKDSCSRCYQGECTKGLECFSKCTVNSDCDQTGDCVVCSSRGFCLSVEKAQHVDNLSEQEALLWIAEQTQENVQA